MTLKGLLTVLKESFLRLSPVYLIKNPTMFLAELAFFIALVYSAATGLRSPYAIAIIVLLFLTVWFGTLSDAFSEFKTKSAADLLISAASSYTARKVDPRSGAEVIVSAEMLRPGDIIEVRAGEIIPIDGVIVEGEAAIDESLVTGESVPVIKSANDEVIGGSKVVSDSIKVKVVKSLEESFVIRVARLISSSKRPRGENERALHVLVSMFAVLFSTIIIFLYLLLMAEGVVPNPLILMAFYVCLLPTTIGALEEAIGISGIAKLLQMKVIAKSGKAVENAGDVDVVLLDKTGTVTIGKREPVRIVPLKGHTEKEVAEAAFLSSVQDDTPEGKAIIRFLQSKGYISGDLDSAMRSSYEEFSAKTRKSGVFLKLVDGKGKEVYRSFGLIRKSDLFGLYLNGEIPVFKGAPDIMKKMFKVPDDFDEKVNEIARNGSSPLAVAYYDEVIGLIELKDVLKEGVKEKIRLLKSMGIELQLITGDHRLTAEAIAKELGVDKFVPEARPEDKHSIAMNEQKKGKVIAMVGDGVNDAPALAIANVGLAMNSGTNVAKEAANMVDLESDPSKLIEVVLVGKRLLTTRGSITAFSIANDISKYFVVLPALIAFLPSAARLDVLGLPLHVAVISALIYNAFIIPALIPLAIRGVPIRAGTPLEIFTWNFLIYGVGGIVLPFLAIKGIGMLIMLMHLV